MEAKELTELEAARRTIDSLVLQNSLAISLLRAVSWKDANCSYCEDLVVCSYCGTPLNDKGHMCELHAFLENL